MTESLSYAEAVHLFEQWGFRVEAGPRPHEVTLILEGADSRTYLVYDVALLPQIAEVVLQTRWRNGKVLVAP